MRRSLIVCLAGLLGLGVRAAGQELPAPPLDLVEPAVASQINGALQAVRDAATARDVDRGALAEAYGALARVYHAYEFFDAAEAAYREAMRLARRDYRWPHLLGSLYEQGGRFDEALDLYLEALRLDPADHAAVIRLGDVYLQLDRRGEARTQFEAARARFPLSAAAGLGEVALRERRFTDAVALLGDVLRRAPHATRLHYSLAMAYRGLGRMDDARRHLEQAGTGSVRAADPLVDGLPQLLQGARATLNHARVELQAGAYDAAVAAFRRAVAAAPDSLEARTGLAAALEREGKREEALAEIGRAEDLLLARAIAFADQQRFREAIDALDRGAQLLPGRRRIQTTLARLLAASPDRDVRNGERALVVAREVYGTGPDPVGAETVALALVELGRCDEASDWMRRAVNEAGRLGDDAEAARLSAELSRYPAVCSR